MYPAMRPPTRSQTSGWGWKAHAFTTASTRPSPASRRPEVKHAEGSHVHEKGEDQPRPEEPPEDRRIEPQVHEKQHDHHKLHRHQDEQHGQLEPAEVGEVGRYLEPGHRREGERDLD